MLKPIKLAAIFMALLMGFASVPIAQGAAFVNEYADRSAQEAIISEYFDCINRADWDGWVQCAAPAVRNDKQWLVSDESHHRDNIGILTVNHASVLEMKKVSNEYALSIYHELVPYYSSNDTHACYKVRLNLEVNADNGFFADGVKEVLVILIKDNNKWFFGAMYNASEEFSARQNAGKGIGYGLINYTSEPTSITVLDDLDNIVTVSFDEFIFNVTCNEIGNMGYDTDAIYANIIAVKMVGWWAVAGSFQMQSGYHISNGYVNFCHSNAATPANQTIIRSAVNAMDNYRMVSSTGTGGKLFFANYAAGQSNADGKGSGILRQNGSNYLAKNLGYSWKKILRYYYDNSSKNGTNVGTIQILCIGSHSWGDWNSNSSNHWKTCTRCDAKTSVGAHSASGTYQSNDTTHWRFCGVCDRKLSEAHTWIQLSSYYRCSVCGRTQQTVPGTQSLSK